MIVKNVKTNYQLDHLNYVKIQIKQVKVESDGENIKSTFKTLIVRLVRIVHDIKWLKERKRKLLTSHLSHGSDFHFKK